MKNIKDTQKTGWTISNMYENNKQFFTDLWLQKRCVIVDLLRAWRVKHFSTLI